LVRRAHFGRIAEVKRIFSFVPTSPLSRTLARLTKIGDFYLTISATKCHELAPWHFPYASREDKDPHETDRQGRRGADAAGRQG
jgi:hypothetical protein